MNVTIIDTNFTAMFKTTHFVADDKKFVLRESRSLRNNKSTLLDGEGKEVVGTEKATIVRAFNSVRNK